MASTPDSAIFPPLDKCLAREERILSWKTVYRTLCDNRGASQSGPLEHLLSDDQCQRLLSHPLEPFAQPSAKSKSDFTTKTAPINVSQSISGDYDLAELKDDALWLSEKLAIEELFALRIAILEWQRRPADQLFLGPAALEDGLVAATGHGASFFGKSMSNAVASPATPSLKLGTEDVRRERQLEIYLEEKSHILKLATLLVGHQALNHAHPQLKRSWIDDIASQIAVAMCPIDDRHISESTVDDCIKSIETKLVSLDDASKRPETFTASDSRQLTYMSATFQDVISIMRLILDISSLCSHVLRPEIIQSWYTLMARYGFLQDLTPSLALSDPSVLQSLISVVSLAVLQVPENIERIHDSARSALDSPVYPSIRGDSWFFNDACVKEVNIILCRAAQSGNTVASPAILAWGLLTGTIRDAAKASQEFRDQLRLDDGSSDGESPMRRRSSIRESRLEQSLFEARFQLLQDFELDADVRDDPPSYLVRAAVDQLQVLSVMSTLSLVLTQSFGRGPNNISTSCFARLSLLDLGRQALYAVSYGEEILEAILTILAPNIPEASEMIGSLLANHFAGDDDVFHSYLVKQVLARYPLELTPMLRVFAILSSASSDHNTGPATVVQLLESLSTMTVMTPEGFRAYILDHEDENTNSMLLTNNLPLFMPRQRYALNGSSLDSISGILFGDRKHSSLNVTTIPPGASGVVARESRPMIFKLDHVHSALEYLGLLLSTIRTDSELISTHSDSHVDLATAADIVALLVALIKTSLRQSDGIEEARFVLGRFSFVLPNEQDIISIVADIFETELVCHLDQAAQNGSVELLVACVEFLDLLVAICPGRVWSILANSSLLGVFGGTNALASIVAVTEVHIGQYPFLIACARLYLRLLEETITGFVKQKSTNSKVSNRFDPSETSTDHTPERSISSVIGAYQNVMLDVWQSSLDWHFVSPSEKFKLTFLVSKAFNKTLLITHGIRSTSTTGVSLSKILLPSAQSLLNNLTSASGNSALPDKFEAILARGIALADDTIPIYERIALIEQTEATIALLTTIVRSRSVAQGPTERASVIGSKLLETVPTIAILFAAEHSLRADLASLLDELVQALSEHGEARPPSLLERLTPNAASSFLSIVSQLDRPLKDVTVESSMWNFLSSTLASKQQWFAMYLLTGSLPKDRLKENGNSGTVSKSKPLLAYALDELSKIATLSPEQATAMLRFVASAQNAWVWATSEVRSHSDFLKNTLEWLNKLQLRASNVGQELILAMELQMAAYLCDILAVNLHASLESGDKSLLRTVLAKLGFLRDHAVRVDMYNRSLHRNLAENFRRKFSGCSLEDFKRTAVNPAPLGRDYIFDLNFATQVLKHDMAWHGATSGRNQGFIDEFARANINLSLVDSQMNLLKSWNALAVVLSDWTQQEISLQAELAGTVERCLTANADADLEQPGMGDVVRARTEMAFVIITKLVNIKSEAPEMKSLLSAAWNLARASPVDYDVATTTEDVQYYRILLQVLYLAIQPHIYAKAPANPNRQMDATDETKVDLADPSVTSYLVEIVAKIIAPGFRALCGNLHNNIALALPGDFALLTSLLQAVLSVPGVSAVHVQIADIVASTSIIRGALSLYSWADQLAEGMDHDPIYGEFAVMLLLELSSVRPIAEQVALDGALAQLSSANISNYLRKPEGKGPFDEPQRMFSIWTDGLLPLCLHLLDAVGPPIAAEIATFLNSFPTQLGRAQRALENREPTTRHPHAGAVTLGLASEAHLLCLIAVILSTDTARGAADGIDAAEVPRLNFDQERVKDSATALTRQKTSLAARIVPVNERELEWASRSVEGPHDNLLQAKVLREIDGLVACFGDGS